MPAVVAAAAVTAGAQITSNALAGRAQGRANDRATRASTAANDAQLAYLRGQEAEDRRRYDNEQAQAKAAWDAEQSRLAPYRAASASILGRTMGMRVPAYQPSAGPGPTGAPASRYAASLPGLVGGAPSAYGAQTIQAPQLTVADIASGRF